MDISEIPNDKREFRCPHCNGQILIPRNLPPTTSPCPHCGKVITSPAPERPATPPPAITPASPPPPSPVSAPKPAPSVAKPSAPEPTNQPQDRKKAARQKSGLIPIMLVLLLLSLAIGGAVFFLTREMGQNIPPPAVGSPPRDTSLNKAAPAWNGWQKEASQVLHDYLAATTIEGKLPYILNGESLAPRLKEFYVDHAITDTNTPAKAFSVNPLTEEDYKRGIFMLVFDQPGQNPVRVHAFFKRTPEGLKLDWETFAQTKYRTLQNFIKTPKKGSTGIFRVLMIEDIPDSAQANAGTRTFRIADPAHTNDTTKVEVAVDSETGRALSAVNWRGTNENRPAPRTATIELRWGGESQAPKLEINRLICWEFLGLGGQESPPVTQ